MDRRARRGVLALTAVAAACGAAGDLPGDRDPAGGPSPALSRAARAVVRAERTTAVRVTWILRAEDCFTCLTPATELRRLESWKEVSLAVVVVGNGVREVRAVMRRLRVGGELTTMTPRRYRRAFGRLPLPAVYVVRGDSLVGAWFGEDAGRAEIRNVSLGALGAATDAARPTLPGTRVR